MHLHNVFGVSEDSVVRSVFILHENLIEISLKRTISVKAISVCRINYERMDAHGHFFQDIINDFAYLLSDNRIFLTGQFDINQNYAVRINQELVFAVLDTRLGGILDTHFDITGEDGFGGYIVNTAAFFKLWSPPAGRVEVVVYDEDENRLYTEEPLLMTRGTKGVWYLELMPETVGLDSLDGCYYKYAVYAYGAMRIGLDPYALSMAEYSTDGSASEIKAALIDCSKVQKFKHSFKNSDTCPNETDIIAYEINVRDFTIQPGVCSKQTAGTFLGFIEKLDYLSELGISHLQLLPVNKCFTLDETDREYTGNHTLDSNYNWGYDPLNYFTLEGRYCTEPSDPYSRIAEYRQLADALHERKIGIINDVVFNHTYSANVFECVAPGCYYRLDENYRISGFTGAGSSLESRRKSVRKFIIDALLHFVRFYGSDGFRFDLMGFTDIETLTQIRQIVGAAYNPKNPYELILQGEAWEFTDINDGTAYTKLNHPGNLGIALFNDSFRDACTGHDSYPGFAQGNGHEISRLATGILGGLMCYEPNTAFTNQIFDDIYNRFAFEPGECLNYFAIHDGLTLWDKINLSVNDESKEQRIRIAKFAFAILLTSQGRVILHGGDEILRTKPLAHNDKEKHRAMSSHQINEEEGIRYFHENSYSSPDYTNMFRWERLENRYFPFATDLLNYVRGLIQIRKLLSALRLPTAAAVNQNFQFLHPLPIYNVEGSFFNLKKFTINFKNGIPNATYYIVGEIHEKNTNPLLNPYSVTFDSQGFGKISFSETEIRKFNIRKWSRNLNLHFKLIKTTGKWDYLSYAYSSHGENAVSARRLNPDGEVWIDLSIKNDKVIEHSHHVDIQTLAFESACAENSKYSSVIIAHNGGSMVSVVNYDKIFPENFDLLADNRQSGLIPITHSEAKIEQGRIHIPPHSSIILAHKNPNFTQSKL